MLVGAARSPDVIQRGKAQTLSLALYSDASFTLSSGTFSLYDADNTARISAAAATVSGATASYALGATVLNDYAFGEGWREEWVLTLGSGEVCTFRRPAILAFRQLYPTVQPSDLSDLHSELPQVATYTVDGTETTWEVYAWRKLDVVWSSLLRWLWQGGKLPNRLTGLSLHDLHLCATLEAVYRDLRAQTGDRYDRTLTDYVGKVQALKATASLEYDADDDGAPDEIVPPQGPVSLSCGPTRRVVRLW